jgi:hypothetical protein
VASSLEIRRTKGHRVRVSGEEVERLDNLRADRKRLAGHGVGVGPPAVPATATSRNDVLPRPTSSVSLQVRTRIRSSLVGQQRMEPLWSPVVATGGDRSQIAQAQTPPKQAKPLPWVATGCRKQRMVRRGSTVRVRQRALQKRRITGLFPLVCPATGRFVGLSGPKWASRAGPTRCARRRARRSRPRADAG